MILDGRMPTPEEAEAQLRQRLAAEDAASPAGFPAGADADDLRVDSIAAQLEEVEQQRLTDDWLEEQEHPDANAWHWTSPAGKTNSRHDDKGGGRQ
jgi:hypothetical protein